MKRSYQFARNSDPTRYQNSSHDMPPWGNVLMFCDTVLFLLCSKLAFMLALDHVAFEIHYVVITIILMGLLIPASYLFGVYRYWNVSPFSREIRAIFSAWIITLVTISFLAILFKANISYSRVWFGLCMISWLVLVILMRIAFRRFMEKREGKHWNKINIFIVGINDHSFSVAETINNNPWSGIKILGFYASSKDALEKTQRKNDLVLGDINDLIEYLDEKNDPNSSDNASYINQVWITTDKLDTEQNRILMQKMDRHSVDLLFVPDLRVPMRTHQQLLYVSGIPVVSMSSLSLSLNQRMTKLIEDYILSSIILLMISPLMVILAIGVKLSSPGPVFYRQRRVTRNGKHFDILKFRSMPVNVESNTGAIWSKKGEKRATKFGTFLRRTSLDELPQFINVLKGEMSIVGPRPERPEFVDKFKDEIPSYMRKHLLKAGITGWAQINGYRGDTDLNKRIEYDLFYIDHWSLGFDLRIIVQTIYKGFIHAAAH